MPVDIKQIESVFLEVVAAPDAAGRLAILNERAGSDPELRKKVEELLLAHDEPGSFLSEPAISRMHTSVLLDDAALNYLREEKVTTVSAGTVLGGRYRLLETIGEGGMGSVWMAEQREPVRRRVALKLIKPGMDSKAVLARFDAERQALAMMDHPNIAKVFDGGMTEQGLPFFVMELVKGIPLMQYCDERKLSIRDRLGLFVPICQAVQHAHQKGIIHRDLKPSNILVTEMDGQPVPKVIDFGLAKTLQGGHTLTDQTLYTAFGAMVGTPLYMAPEQVGINALDVDTRTDIYSLGVILYELLTGTTPLETARLKAAAWDEVRRLIREEDPPKPSMRLSTTLALPSIAASRQIEPAKLGKLIRGDLDWIVLKAMEKKRSRRYETANGFARDIERYLADEPVEARSPSAGYRARKFIHRNKVPVAAVVAVALALIIGLGASTWMFLRERQARARAVTAEQTQSQLRRQAQAEERTARTEAVKSEQVARFLEEMLKGVGPSVALGRDTTMLREILDKTAERIDKDLKVQPEVQIELRLTLATIYHELGLFKRMEEMARGTLALARSVFGEENLEVADALGQLGDALHHLPKSDEAETINREAVAMQHKLRGSGSLQEAASLYHLSYVLNDFQRKSAEAESMSRAALAIRRKLLGNEHQDVARSLDNLSFVLASEKKLAEAEAAAREALVIRKKLFGDPHPELGRSLKALGDVLKQEGKYAEAEELYRQLLPGTRKTLGEHHPLVGGYYSGFANVLNDSKRRGESAQSLQEAIAVLERAMADSPDQRQSFLQPQAHNHRLLAFHYWNQRNYSGARESFGIATDLFRQSAEASQATDTATALQGEADDFLCIGQLWEAESHSAEAKEAYRQALALHERIEKEGRAQDITVGWMPNHYIQLAQLVEKVATREDALGIAQILHTPKQGLSADALKGLQNCHFQLAMVLQRHGSPEEAIQLLQNLRAKLTADDPSLVAALSNLASCLRQNEKPTEAESVLRELLAIQRKFPGNEQSSVVTALATLAELLMSQGKVDEAEALVDPLSPSSSQPSRDNAALFRSLGEGHAIQGRWRQAAARFAVLMKLNEFDGRDEITLDHARYAPTLIELGDVQGYERYRQAAVAQFAQTKDPIDAERIIKLSLLLPADENLLKSLNPLYEAAVVADPDKHLPTPGICLSLGLFEYRRNEYAKALDWFRRDLTYGPYGGDGPRNATSRVILAMCLHQLHRDEEGASQLARGRESIDSALRRGLVVYGDGFWFDWVIARILLREANQLMPVMKVGITSSPADDIFENALDVELLQNVHARLPAESVELANWLAQITSGHLEGGRFVEAEQTARECLAIREKKTPDDWVTFNARNLLGCSLLGQKKYAEAEPILLAGYEGMKRREDQIPEIDKPRLKETLDRLVGLYDATSRPDQAAKWQSELKSINAPKSGSTAAASRPQN